MKVYKITKPNSIELINVSEGIDNDTCKVKIIKAGISNSDIKVFRGEHASAQFPITPAKQGMGIVSEVGNNDMGISKNDRVYISPYVSCLECPNCRKEQFKQCDNIRLLGIDTNGLLGDFAVVPLKNVYKLPDNVDNMQAMFVDYISLGLTLFSKINLKKGEHIVIVGATKLGNILSQLALYNQAIPILVDNDQEGLEIVSQAGIYYTINTTTADAAKVTKELTGGRMAEKVIHLAATDHSLADSIKLAANNGYMAVAGFETKSLTADFSKIIEKQLTIVSANSGQANTSGAINMLATKIIQVGNLIKQTVPFEEVPSLFAKLAKQPSLNAQIIIDC